MEKMQANKQSVVTMAGSILIHVYGVFTTDAQSSLTQGAPNDGQCWLLGGLGGLDSRTTVAILQSLAPAASDKLHSMCSTS